MVSAFERLGLRWRLLCVAFLIFFKSEEQLFLLFPLVSFPSSSDDDNRTIKSVCFEASSSFVSLCEVFAHISFSGLSDQRQFPRLLGVALFQLEKIKHKLGIYWKGNICMYITTLMMVFPAVFSDYLDYVDYFPSAPRGYYIYFLDLVWDANSCNIHLWDTYELNSNLKGWWNLRVKGIRFQRKGNNFSLGRAIMIW